MTSTPSWLRERGRPVRRWLALAVALGEASAVLLILQTAFLVRIGDGLIFQRGGLAALQPFFLALPAVIAVRALAVWGSRRAAFACASGVKRTLRAELAARLREIGPIALAGMRAGEIADTVVDGVEALDAYYSRYLPQRAAAALLPFTILAVVFPLDWISGLVLVLTAVFLPLNMIVIGEEAHARSQRLWARIARFSGRWLDVLQGLATVRMFGAARREAEEIARASQEYRASTMSVLKIAFLSSLLLELISAVSVAMVAILCGLRLLAGSMRFAPGYFILLIAPEYFLSLRTLAAYYHARMEAVSAGERVRLLLEAAPPGRDSGGSASADRAASADRPPAIRRAHLRPPSIVFRRVSFSYPRRPVLAGVDFAVAAGEHVTLAGASGAGKTTILHLLLGFLRPERGDVLIDGRPFGELGRSEWLERVAWLPQRPTLFHGTILENIRLGRRSATGPDIREAARLARVDEFAERLPAGLETCIGEGGQGLSAGQIQRVALARLFLRDPGLVLLDEPTAHLDAESERLVNEAIRALAAGRTMILASHRPAAAASVDRALLVRDGRVEAAP